MLISVIERRREQKIYDLIKLPKCSSGQKIPGCGFHHLLTVSVPLSLSFSDILSPWTLFPSQFIPLSSPFLSFHPFLFLSLSVSLRVCCISPSLSFSDPQAISGWLLHLSVTHHCWDCHTGGGCSSVFMTASDICTCFLFLFWGLQGVIPREGRMSTGLDVQMNYISLEITMLLVLERVKIEWRLSPRWSFFRVSDSFMVS